MYRFFIFQNNIWQDIVRLFYIVDSIAIIYMVPNFQFRLHLLTLAGG